MSPTITGADALVEALNEGGIGYLFGNFGSDHAGVIESLAQAKSNGRPHPQVIICPHEMVALSAAHGFAQVARQPQAVFVHCDVGTANLGGSVHNAARSRIPVFIFAGATPFTLQGELPGGRNREANFAQDVYDQRGLVRPYVKWEYDLRTGKNVKQVVRRALTLAKSEPQGPVYLAAPRETLEESAGSQQWVSVPALTPSALPPASVNEITQALLAARRPLILTTYAGRNPSVLPTLIKLAERLAIPVVELRATYNNFPASHPLHQGYEGEDLLENADLVLALDCELPWLPSKGGPVSATVYSIDVDPLKENLPLWEIPASHYFKADVLTALTQLHTRLDDLAWNDRDRDQRERFERLEERHARIQENLNSKGQDGLNARRVGIELKKLLGEEAIIVDEAVTSSGALRAHLPRDRPGTFYSNGGTALGWALGAAIGIKLASPDQTVVALVGDGAYMLGAPTAAFWTARHANAPFLTVILNNGGWNATRQNVLRLYPEGAAARDGQFQSQFEPRADLAQVAVAAGDARGFTVSTEEQLGPILAQALSDVENGHSAVVDVRLPSI